MQRCQKSVRYSLLQRHIRDHTFLQRFLGPIMSNHVQSQHDNRIQQTITPGHPRSTDALQHPESACNPYAFRLLPSRQGGKLSQLEVPSQTESSLRFADANRSLPCCSIQNQNLERNHSKSTSESAGSLCVEPGAKPLKEAQNSNARKFTGPWCS